MATVEREHEFSVSADELWNKIGDFTKIDDWAKGIESVEISDGGKTRTITLGGNQIVEHLVEEGDRSYTYSLDPGGMMPVLDYRSTIAVKDAGDGKCVVHWKGTFEPAEGTTEEAASQIVGMVYDSGLAGMSS
jgi:hypothetical protein